MEIVIAAVVVALGLAAGLVVAALLLSKRMPGGLERKAPAAPARVPEAPTRGRSRRLSRGRATRARRSSAAPRSGARRSG